MDNPKGGECRTSSHEVKTLKTGREWLSSVTANDLPVQIDQRTTSDGRMFAYIYNKDGKLIGKRG